MGEHITQYAFPTASNKEFHELGRILGRFLATKISEDVCAVQAHGQTFYHPFQVSIEGKPASGKSRLFKAAAQEITQGVPTESTEELVRSEDNTRDILSYARWITEDFEIRLQDEFTSKTLPSFDRLGVCVFEHPSQELQKYCRMNFLLKKLNPGVRTLLLRADEDIIRDPCFQSEVLDQAGHLLINS